jgi:hypothetical protein
LLAYSQLLVHPLLTLGHPLPAFTIDTYQHVLPGMQAEAARTFEKLIKENPPGDRR